MTRAEAIAVMQAEGHPQDCIDRWLQGNDHAADRRRLREPVSVRIWIHPPARLVEHDKASPPLAPDLV